MTWRDTTCARLGFDASRLPFALRTAAAACIALLLGWLCGLEHPQWSAMTVWAASVPVRGHLLEKGFFRVAGTVGGTLAGIALIAVSASPPWWWLVIGLALWIGLCAGIGNVQRGFVSYGTMLAGYSAAMVALLGLDHPEHIGALAADRLLTVLLGVAVALLAGWFFAPSQSEDAAVEQLRGLSSRLLHAMARRVGGQRRQPDEETLRGLLSAMAAIDDRLDPLAAGSLRSRRSVHAIRMLLSTQVSAILWLSGDAPAGGDAGLSAALGQAARALESATSRREIDEALRLAVQASPQTPSVHAVLADMSAAWHGLPVSADGGTGSMPPHSMVLHRDWVGAREALVRATSAMLLVGALWLLTGWSAGPYMLLGTAVMVSLFSTFDNPASTMRMVLFGQLLGVTGALACRWLVWPHAGTELELVLLTMPFVFLGALLFSHRRTMAGGFDYNMVMLLLLQPALPLTGSLGHSLSLAAAVLLAPIAAVAAYRLIYPASARRRLDTLVSMMVQELERMAGDQRAGGLHRGIWRARLYHRLLRLVRWTEKTGGGEVSAMDGSLAVLDLGRAVFRAQDLRQDAGISARTGRRIEAALSRMRAISQDPRAAARAWGRLALALSSQAHEDAGLFAHAQRSLEKNLDFFRIASHRS